MLIQSNFTWRYLNRMPGWDYTHPWVYKSPRIITRDSIHLSRSSQFQSSHEVTPAQLQQSGSSIEASVPMASLSTFKAKAGIIKLLAFFILAFSCLSLVAAAPTESGLTTLSDVEKRDASTLSAPAVDVDALAIRTPVAAEDDVSKRSPSAGLYWGPVFIGNLKLTLTNPHPGFAGPKFEGRDPTHINFHVYLRGPRADYKKELVNLHIVRYSSGGRDCLYMWDSVSKKTIFDNCFDDWSNAIPEAVRAAKATVDTILRNADPIAAVAVIAALGVALAAVLAGLGVAVVI